MAKQEILIDGELVAEDLGPEPSEFTKRSLEGWQSYVEHDQDIKIGVYRLGGRKEPNLFNFYSTDYSPDDLMEKLREEFGQGEYALKAWGKGKKGLIFNKQISIEEARVDPVTKLGDEMKTIIAAQNQQQPRDNGNTELIGLMMNMQQQNTQMMVQASKDSQAQLNQLLTVMMPIIAQKPETQKQPDILEMLVKLQALTPKPADPMDGFFKGVEMMKEMGGGGESNENDVFRDMFKALSPLAEKVVSEAKIPPAPVVAQEPTRIAPEPLPKAEPSAEQVQHKILQDNIAKLLAFARAGTDPISVVDMINVTVADEQLQLLEKFLNRPDWLAMLQSANPEIETYAKWFTLLREEFLSDPDDPGAIGNEQDLNDNADITDQHNEEIVSPDGLPPDTIDEELHANESEADES